jgi:hypothetical protein
MPIPEDTCVSLEIDIQALLGLNVTLPGGVSLNAKLEAGEFPSLSGIVASVLEPLNAALTPLMPFFNLIDLVMAIVEFCKAVPGAFGPPPDPAGLIEAIQKVIKAAAKVSAILPPLSVPIMIVGICKLITTGLRALIEELENIIEASLKLNIGRQRAATLAANPLLLEGAAALEAAIDCAQANLDVQVSLGVSSLGPLNKFIDLLNLFMELIGLDPFISIEAGGDAGAMLEPLRIAVDALEAICGNIPV